MRSFTLLLIVGSLTLFCTAARAQRGDQTAALQQEQPTLDPQLPRRPHPAFVLRSRQIACQKWNWGWITLGTGGAVLIGAVITGSMTAVNAKDLEDRCPNKHCPDADDRDLKNRVDTLAHTTDLLISFGSVLAVSGAVLLIGAWIDFESDEDRSFALAPVIAPDTGGLVVDWRF